MENTPFIYVIEDEESISKLITLYLTKEKMDSKAFFNAEDALKEIMIIPREKHHQIQI
ncbi:MAG: hypothetical protein MSH65_03600 [Spirochaetia bacterium]|nr:hypothetical protein [Spirochaetia bacterium]